MKVVTAVHLTKEEICQLLTDYAKQSAGAGAGSSHVNFQLDNGGLIGATVEFNSTAAKPKYPVHNPKVQNAG